MDAPTDTGFIDFPSGDGPDSGREVDAETNVSAASLAFNSAALPDNLPDWLKDALLDKAEQVRDAAGDLVIDNRMNPNDVRSRQAKADADDEDNLAQYAQLVRQEQMDRAWTQSQTKIGSVTMTGAEWDAAYELLSDPEMRESLIDRMTRAKGWSKDRAEKAADDALTLAQIAQRKKDGTITAADETKADEITRRNPDAVEMVKEAARDNQKLGMATKADASASTESALSGDITTATVGYQNAMRDAAPITSQRAANDVAFASAPDLAAHFEEARNATLATSSAEPAKPLPQQLVAKIDMNGPF